MSQNQKAIILLSGGLDSSTVLKIAISQGYSNIYAMTFDYGQRNKFEIEAAKIIATECKVLEHKIITINLGVFAGSSLTSDLEVEQGRSLSEIGTGIPSTYVPARNTIFLTYALAWSEVLEVCDIFIGANSLDYSGYPDCRPDYFKAFEIMANLATKIGTEGKSIKIHTPLINLRKIEIIKKGLELGVDYSKTITCYNPNSEGHSCGTCDACTLRKDAYSQIGLRDPICYL